MSTLLPTLQARDLQQALLDYLTTTFALTDADVRAALGDFLTAPETGIFKGPWTRLKVPFAPAEDGWADTLDWLPDGFTPHAHQARAFARLSTRPTEPGADLRAPQPTLVTTGTGSGKTESFLYPILDHVLRARSLGITGLKALILYPMNALAGDQADRLTGLITGDPRLTKVRAAIYTGETDGERTLVSERGLISDRTVIRDDPPDILLTNYKMLDQLLLRPEDRKLWTTGPPAGHRHRRGCRGADSLTYLVLDEFHTYDGAQGTDVAMLLRRLGLVLARHRSHPSENPGPLGPITPVATSATLGDGGDPSAMIDFARTVFGTDFDRSSVITEQRLDVDEWARSWAGERDPAPELTLSRLIDSLDELDATDDPEALTAGVLGLFTTTDAVPDSPAERAGLLLASAQVRELFRDGPRARSSDELAATVIRRPDAGGLASRWTDYLLATLSRLRQQLGRSFVDVETHMWLRELTRVDRLATSNAMFRWADDAEHLTGDSFDQAWPALYCRHCGRSGWGVYRQPTSTSLGNPRDIRARHRNREPYFRALIHAGAEALTDHLDGITWWDTTHGTLTGRIRLSSASPA